MANIKHNSLKLLKQDTFITFTWLCLMLCMVMTLLGIKFRWFKHRMTFEQIPNDGILNGSSNVNGVETIAYRKKTKPSQQFLQPVIVHGIFRKRQEDDIEYERPKSLPPIRIRKSSNAPPALLPPRRRSQIQSEIIENLPKSESSLQISSSESNLSTELNPNNSSSNQENNQISNEPIYAETIKKFKPKKTSINDKTKITNKHQERRPTGFVSLTDDERKELELSAAVINDIDLMKLNFDKENDDEKIFEIENKINFDNDKNKTQIPQTSATPSLPPLPPKATERRITFSDQSPENIFIHENWFQNENNQFQNQNNECLLSIDFETLNKTQILSETVDSGRNSMQRNNL